MQKTPTKDFNYAAKLPDPASVKKRDAPAPAQKLPQPGLGSRQMQNQMAMDAAAAKQNAASTSKAATSTPQVKPEFNKAVKGPSRGRSI